MANQPQYSGAPVQTVNNALLFRKSAFQYGSKHVEANTLYDFFGKAGVNSEYLGMLKLFGNRFRETVPLISSTELSNNVMYVKGLGTMLGFSLPYRVGLPIVKENLVGSIARPGLNGTHVPLVLSANTFTYGDIITWDKYDGAQLRISVDHVNHEIVEFGDGWKYMVALSTVNGLHEYIPHVAFEPGREYVKIGNPSGEFDTHRSGLMGSEWGLAHYSFETASATRGIETWITQNADILEMGETNRDFTNSAFWGEVNDTKTILNLMNAQKDAFGNIKQDINGQALPDPSTLRWTPMVIARLYEELAKMEENDLMWSKGGVYYDAKGKMFRSGVGFWPQMKSGNYIQYTDTRQLLPILKNAIAEMFAGSSIPLWDRVLEIELGMGAMIDLQTEFMQEFKIGNPFATWTQDIKGMLTGDVMNLKFTKPRFVEILWPETGTIRLKHNPALDYTDNGTGARSESSIEGNWDTRSYTIIVKDVTKGFTNRTDVGFQYSVREGFDNGANTVMIKPKNFSEAKTSYLLGTHCPDMLKAYVGVGRGHVASTPKKGFGVIVDNASQVWIKDVTRTLLIEKVDPAKYYF